MWHATPNEGMESPGSCLSKPCQGRRKTWRGGDYTTGLNKLGNKCILPYLTGTMPQVVFLEDQISPPTHPHQGSSLLPIEFKKVFYSYQATGRGTRLLSRYASPTSFELGEASSIKTGGQEVPEISHRTGCQPRTFSPANDMSGRQEGTGNKKQPRHLLSGDPNSVFCQ